MSTSPAKVAANRINGRKSKGPLNTTATRFNAQKHALTSAGLTELDDIETYNRILRGLHQENAPAGIYEVFLLECAALDMIRSIRARRLEAENITEALHPPLRENPLEKLYPLTEGKLLDPGLPATIPPGTAEYRISPFQRYETSYLNRLIKTMREFDRHQRMHDGERLPGSNSSGPGICQSPESLKEDPELRDAPVVLPESLEDSTIEFANIGADPEAKPLSSGESEKGHVQVMHPKTPSAADSRPQTADAAQGNTWLPPSRQGPLWSK
jgi:hypothetical protein